MFLYLAHHCSSVRRVVSNGINLCSLLLILNANLHLEPSRHLRSGIELACYGMGFCARTNDQYQSLFKYLSFSQAKYLCYADPASLICLKFNCLSMFFCHKASTSAEHLNIIPSDRVMRLWRGEEEEGQALGRA